MSEESSGAISAEAVITPQTEVGATETTEIPKVEVPKKEDFLAPKFAALTRKEKQVRAMEQSVKQQMAEIERMRADFEGKSKSTAAQEAQLLNELKANPLKFMEKHGLSFDQLTQMQLNEQNPTTEMMIARMREELKAEMGGEIESVKKSLKDKEELAAKQQYEAAVTGYKTELTEFVKQNADTYELIVANGATELMFETAEAYYAQTGKVPNNEELAKAVEEHLEERAREILKLKKFQPQTAKTLEANTSKTAPTLSNTLAAEVPKTGSKILSDEESRRQAAKLLRWDV